MRLPSPPHFAAVAQTATYGLAQSALIAACVSSLLVGQPAPALAAPTLNEAIVEVSESSYPVLKALKAEEFTAFSEKLGGLILDSPSLKPDQLTKSIELGLDVFNSVPESNVKSFVDLEKKAFSGLSTDSCTLVPLPSARLGDKFGKAAAGVDAEKLKAFGQKYNPTLSAIPKTASAACLPSVAALDELSLAQAELGRSFGAAESKAFGAYAAPLLQRSVSFGQIMGLAGDAKRLATLTPQEGARFQAAGKAVEIASKREAAQARVAASAPAVKSPEEREAEAKARKEEAEKQQAAAAEAQAAKVKAAAEKKAALEAAEKERIAALKAKAAAIEAAKKK